MFCRSFLLFLSLIQLILARPAPFSDNLAQIDTPLRPRNALSLPTISIKLPSLSLPALPSLSLPIPTFSLPLPTPSSPGRTSSPPLNTPSPRSTPPYTTSKPPNTTSSPPSTTSTRPSTTSNPPSTTSTPSSTTSTVGTCTNSPSNRQCWSNGYDIQTNAEASWPNTGRTVSYNLVITNTTMSLDGVPRPVYAVNGQYPGPTIRANWGDMLQITVTNSLTTNGTSIHWHGIRQWQSNPMDGTNGITECPLAPGQTRTYNFIATHYGTSWYHSHFATQYSDGVLGTIVIDGPTSANYDEDLGVMPITDWFHTPVFTLVDLLYHARIQAPPSADTVLINGTNVNPSGSGGAYAVTKIKPGKKYKLRLINTSTNDNFQVGLDGHKLTVVGADFVPITPYTTDWLFMSIGQRYDVIIDAAATNTGSFWFHAVPQNGCSNNKVKNALSIFTYTSDTTPSASSPALPSADPSANLPPTTVCTDPVPLTPYIPLSVPSTTNLNANATLPIGFNASPFPNPTIVNWTLSNISQSVNWSAPTLSYVLSNSINSIPPSYNVIKLSPGRNWSYWVVQATSTLAPPQAHPIHLHGHNFYVLGAGTGTFSQATNGPALNFNNPTRRDTATLPASGWLVLAFETDNPGAWLMHCHVAWHVDLGLGMQFLEGVEQIPGLVARTPGWQQECNQWNAYYPGSVFKEEASGL